MTPAQIVLLVRTLVAIACLVALWWAGGQIVDAIRAPVAAERDTAVAANGSLAKRLNEAKAEAERLDGVLAEREAREKQLRAENAAMRRRLADLKAGDPEVRKWAETPIPPALLGGKP